MTKIKLFGVCSEDMPTGSEDRITKSRSLRRATCAAAVLVGLALPGLAGAISLDSTVVTSRTTGFAAGGEICPADETFTVEVQVQSAKGSNKLIAAGNIGSMDCAGDGVSVDWRVDVTTIGKNRLRAGTEYRTVVKVTRTRGIVTLTTNRIWE